MWKGITAFHRDWLKLRRTAIFRRGHVKYTTFSISKWGNPGSERLGAPCRICGSCTCRFPNGKSLTSVGPPYRRGLGVPLILTGRSRLGESGTAVPVLPTTFAPSDPSRLIAACPLGRRIASYTRSIQSRLRPSSFRPKGWSTDGDSPTPWGYPDCPSKTMKRPVGNGVNPRAAIGCENRLLNCPFLTAGPSVFQFRFIPVIEGVIKDPYVIAGLFVRDGESSAKIAA